MATLLPLRIALLLVCAATNAAALDLIGYLPYYRMSGSYVSNVLPEQLAMLDEVRYFGLTSDSNGQIVPLGNSLQSHMSNIATVQSVIDGLPEAQRPRLDITLGGAAQDAPFTSVAADAAKRATLAQNVEALLTETGATSIDINWEHPNVGFELTTSYPALLKRIKQEVGPNRRVYATLAPSLVMSNSALTGANAIDGVSLMTYDLGWWSNDPSNPNNGEHSLQEYAEDAVEAWTEPPGSRNDRPWVFGTWGNATPADRLSVALPFYGRALSSQTAYTYSELTGGGTITGGEYYNYQGQQVWAPSPELAAERIEYAYEQGLQHVIIWEIGQDLPPSHEASLLRSAFEAREALVGLDGDFNGDGSVDAADYTTWRDGLGTTYTLSDYSDWRSNFGATATQTATVPEPTTLTLGLVVLGYPPVSLCRATRATRTP
ncbi:MAG: glycoside hydrolase family 18 protein [Planctomycetota bacterium]